MGGSRLRDARNGQSRPMLANDVRDARQHPVFDATIGALVERVAHGDPSAFVHLYDLSVCAVFDRVRAIVSAVDATEDVTREVMVEVWRRAGAVPTDRTAIEWILAVADRRARQWVGA